MLTATIHDVEQRTPGWLLKRAGLLCGSDAKHLFGNGRGGAESAGRRDLRMRLALERLVGEPQQDDIYVNADMQRGIELEPQAITAYEWHRGVSVRPVGFLEHWTLNAGFSPDGLVNDDGLIECKAPRPANHLAYLKAGTLPADHVPQVTHGLWLSGLEWCDFVSFCPKFPPQLQLFVHRVARRDVDIDGYAKKATAFLAECDAEYAALLTMANVGAVLTASLEA